MSKNFKNLIAVNEMTGERKNRNNSTIAPKKWDKISVSKLEAEWKVIMRAEEETQKQTENTMIDSINVHTLYFNDRIYSLWVCIVELQISTQQPKD